MIQAFDFDQALKALQDGQPLTKTQINRKINF